MSCYPEAHKKKIKKEEEEEEEKELPAKPISQAPTPPYCSPIHPVH